MKIGTENIESRIFDYHEGNLSESEKAEVLSYIHTHPEYESDFAQWAQSYLPPDDIKEYNLINRLVQSPAQAWYKKTLVKTLPAVMLTAWLLFYFLPIQTEKTPAQNTVHTEKTESIKQRSEVSPSFALPLRTNQSNSYSRAADSDIPDTKTVRTDQRIDTAAIVTEIPQVFEHTRPVTKTDLHTPVKTTSSDSIMQYKQTQPATESAHEKTDKKRKTYKIKATDKFIPTNGIF